MFKRLKGFTLVEALVIMTVLAILLAATTRLVTRKVVNAPEKNMHGRYEAYYGSDGKARYTYFNGKGKIVKRGECKDTANDNSGRKICPFDPPETAENFHIQAVGGGGAGGSAGGSGTNDGSGSAPGAGGLPTHDVNYGKYKTRPGNTTPFNQYFDLRTYNENNEVVGAVGTPARNGTNLRNPNDTINNTECGTNELCLNANRFKVGVLQNKDFYGTFPAPTQWPKVLGSSKTKPVYGAVPNWFDWTAIASDPETTGSTGKIGKGKIGDFEVIASACSSAGGDGGDFIWKTQSDYKALRDAYTIFGSKTCVNPISCCTSRCSSSTGGTYCCQYTTKYVDSKRTCATTSSLYSCNGSTQTKSGSCSNVCPSFVYRDDEIIWAPRQPVDYIGTIGGQESDGRGVPPTGKARNNIIEPAKWDCAMVTSQMDKGMTASTALSYDDRLAKDKSILAYGEHEMARNDGKLPKGPNLLSSELVKDSFPDGVDPHSVGEHCGKWGYHGVTGTAKINTKQSVAKGGPGGPAFLSSDQSGDKVCFSHHVYDADGNIIDSVYYNRYKYSFMGPHYDGTSYDSTPMPAGQVLIKTGSPFGPGGPWRTPPVGPGTMGGTGTRCETINGYNYCRTGLYNHEYSYEMARGYKQLAYGDRGETGKFETKTVGQIKGPIKITLGKGGEWDPNVKHKDWNKDSGSHGPSGSETIVGNLLTVAGGAGGKGALKTDKYELCSIFDKPKANQEHCKFPDNPASLGANYQYFRMQEGTKGEESKIEPLQSDSAPETPGKGGNGAGTISTREFICNARGVYNLMATNNNTYNDAFKYNGYVIALAFKQEKIDPPDVLCATQEEVGNKYLIKLSSGSYKMGADVKSVLKKELKGDDAAVIITW